MIANVVVWLLSSSSLEAMAHLKGRVSKEDLQQAWLATLVMETLSSNRIF